MKFIFLTVFVLSFNILFGQSSKNSESVSEWTNISYVDLDNDVISSSNLSMGFIGEFAILSYNITYETGRNNYKNGLFFSHTPSFKYGKVGYNHRREKVWENGLKRTNNLGLTFSSSGYTDAVTISPNFNQMYEKNGNRWGYTLYVNDFSWTEFEFDGIIYPSAAETQFSVMLIGMKEFKKNRFTIRPEAFLLSAVYTHFVHLDDIPDALDIWYWNRFNINLYYGSSFEYNLTKRFVLGGKVRSCFNYNVSDKDLGFYKSTPYIVSIGANYDF
jgi:hypothetical protein